MNNLRNKVQLIGHIGKAPEILTFENGNKMAKFSLATNEFYKNAKGEKVEDTQWHNITVWGKQVATIEKYVTKGSEIAVEGKLVTRSFETKEGEKRTKTEIVAHEFLLLSKKSA
ncbi:MAG: single-stranded DNA-binding protein [Crocinitomicaceae bacterium]|jgi:single-strand DNA-binding protein|nr:single-stranded DNA-binding protein [Crocinitomicaceae bacterium]